MITATFLGTLFSLLLLGAWIGVALGITAIVIMLVWGGGIAGVGSIVWSVLNIYSLAAIPGFIFMGEIILKSNISPRIYNSVSPLMARLPGKLLQSNILISALFAAVLGVSTANTAIVGSVAIPELRARKYDEKLLLGTICCGGTLGILIPPSAPFITYGVMANTSIAALFAAGTIPGIFMAILFMVYLGIKGILTPNIAPIGEEIAPLRKALFSLLGIWPLIILMIACVGTIYIGWCTPAEGAGIGAFASIIVGRLFGKLGWQQINESLIDTAEVSAMLFFLILGAMLMSVSVSLIGWPRTIVNLVGGLQLSPVLVLALIYIMYLIMGCFIDGLSMMVTTIPFVMPIVSSLGLDYVWFGVALIILIEIGLITPPVGLNLFIIEGIGGPSTSMSNVIWGSFPFLLITTGVLILITIFPQIVLFLPHLLGVY